MLPGLSTWGTGGFWEQPGQRSGSWHLAGGVRGGLECDSGDSGKRAHRSHGSCLPTGSVDSNWIVGATLEKKLPPLPLTLALGAFLNHRKNKFQCGFGLTIG